MDIWKLNEGDYGALMFSVLMNFSYNLDDDNDEDSESVMEEPDDGYMSFTTQVEIPELKEPFKLIMKEQGGDLSVYEGCYFRDNAFGNNEVSIKYKSQKSFKLEEYRESIINDLI